MKLVQCLLLSLWMTTSMCRASQWFVSTNGSGNGAITNPWMLQVALTNSTVHPGDTVWLRAGTYSNAFTAAISGTSNAPITFRNYNRERAIIDGSLLLGGCTNLWFWGLEFIDSQKAIRSSPFNTCDGGGPGTKWINCLFHDGGIGIGCTGARPGPYEAYGNIMWNCGRANTDHCVYWQNNGPGEKLVMDNIMSNPSGYNICFFGGGVGQLKNMRVVGNAIFLTSGKSGILVGGELPYQDISISNNYVWSYGGRAVELGNGSYDSNAIVTGNYLVGKMTFKLSQQSQSLIYTNNIVFTHNNDYVCFLTGLGSVATNANVYNNNSYYSLKQDWQNNFATLTSDPDNTITFAAWKSTTGFDAASTYVQTNPPDQVIVRPNAYESKRGHVIVWNWSGATRVSVALTNILSAGDTYEIRSGQNYWAGTVATGTFDGNPVSLPMTNLGYAPVLYWANTNQDGNIIITDLSTNFAAFVVLGTSKGLPLAPPQDFHVVPPP